MMNKKMLKNIFVSTILLFLLGALFHFAYNFTNKNFIVGLITPVNESVFEHLKLAFYPILIWWLLFYFFKKIKYSLDKSLWLMGCLISLSLAIITIISIHYIVKYGIGKELVFIDIISLYLALLIGQFTGYHVYNYSKNYNLLLSIILITILTILFITLTISPPKWPIFKDETTQTYGINEKI